MEISQVTNHFLRRILVSGKQVFSLCRKFLLSLFSKYISLITCFRSGFHVPLFRLPVVYLLSFFAPFYLTYFRCEARNRGCRAQIGTVGTREPTVKYLFYGSLVGTYSTCMRMAEMSKLIRVVVLMHCRHWRIMLQKSANNAFGNALKVPI